MEHTAKKSKDKLTLEERYKVACAQAYSNRNRNLKLMGFSSYQDYLASPLWSWIREVAFKIFGRACLFCGGAANQVHHMGYDRNTLEGKKFSKLYPVCPSCHQFGEFSKGGLKYPPNIATRRMVQRARGGLKTRRKKRDLALQEFMKNPQGLDARPTEWEKKAPPYKSPNAVLDVGIVGHDLYNAIWELEGLSGSQKAVALAIAHHKNQNTGQCNPSIERLAKVSGFSDGTVRRALVVLKARGIIRIKSGGLRGEYKRTSTYTFLFSPVVKP